jgi:putative intracellular protease/amidase
MIVTSHDRISEDHPTGLWFEEFAIPYQVFQERGYDITVASPKGGQAPIDPRSAPTADDRARYADALQALADTVATATLTVESFDAVFMPGGHGTMFDLPAAEVGRIVGQFADQGKVIGAVCHGPAGLVNARRADGTSVMNGYQVTGFTNAEEDAAQLTSAMPFLLQTRLAELGAEFIPSPLWNDHVVVDRLLVTGQNPQSSRSTALAFLEVLEGARVPA